MTHDSRRYHRMRRPTFTRGYGALAGLLGDTGAAGAATGAAADAGIGSTLVSGLEAAAGPATTGLAKTALGAFGDIGSGLQSLFTGGGGEAGKLAALGQEVPAGVDLLGPSSTFAGPGFLHSVYQGFIGGPTAASQFASPSTATSLGTGVGKLFDALQQLQQQGGGPAKMPPIVQAAPPIRPLQIVPSGNPMESRAQAPVMSLLHL